MTSIFVSNIPQGFAAEDLLSLFGQAGVHCLSDNLRIMTSKNHGSGQGTGRYAVVPFADQEAARNAVESLSNLHLMINQRPHSLYFSLFIPDLANRTKNTTGMIIIKNLPKDVTASGLVTVFSPFGPVLSARVVSRPMRRPKEGADSGTGQSVFNIGYVMFETDEQADSAVAETNGKFLGVNKVESARYVSAQKRIDNVPTIFMKNIPPEYADDTERFLELLEKVLGRNPREVITSESLDRLLMRKDTRPEPFRTENSWCVVQALSADLAKELINSFMSQNEKYSIDACKFLPRGLRALVLKNKMRSDYEIYVMSKRNISIFGLRMDADFTKMESLLREELGEITQIKYPPDSLKGNFDQDKYHINLLFPTADQAKNAINKLRSGGLLDDFRNPSATFKVEFYVPGEKTRLVKLGAPHSFTPVEGRSNPFIAKGN